jgi:hypothetical protein
MSKVLKSSEFLHWKKVTYFKITTLKKKNTWTLITLLKHGKPFTYNWNFNIKYNIDRCVNKIKHA